MLKIADGLDVQTITQPVLGQFHHAHCSGIVAFDDGELLAVYYHAIKEANRKQAIFGVRKKPGETSWSAPFLVSKDKVNRMEGNPVIWIAPDTKKLWLFYVTSPGGWAVCTPRFKISENRGQSWSKSTKIYWLFSRGLKNPPILTLKGWYILPAYVEFRDYFGVFFISQDHGKTWFQSKSRVGLPAEITPSNFKWGRLVLQPTVIERRDGSLWALMRAKRPLGKMYQTESFDGGLTWTAATPSNLPNPGGGFHMMRLQSGNLGVIYNHAPAEPLNLLERNPLSVAISDDDGKTWKWRRNLCEYHRENQDNATAFHHTFGYPTMCQGPDGLIHATWSFPHPVKENTTRFNITDIQYTCFTEEIGRASWRESV